MGNSIEKDMRTLVRTFSDVTAYIGTGANARLYWTTVPDGTTPSMPYIVYYTISANGELRYIGTRTADVLVRFSVFHTHLQDGLDLANALFDGLSAYHGTPGNKLIHYISCNGPSVMRDPDYETVFQYLVSAEVRYGR